MIKFNELVKQRRLALKESQVEFARRFGYKSGTACSLWEASARKVPTVVIAFLLDLHEITICPHCNGRGFIIK